VRRNSLLERLKAIWHIAACHSSLKNVQRISVNRYFTISCFRRP
jgi:hypothetical protein